MSTILFDIEVAAVVAVMLLILVAAHELGHYLFARLFGMGVEEFAIGMFGRNPLVWREKKYLVPILEGEDPYKHASGMALEGGASTPEVEPEIVEKGSRRYLLEKTTFTFRPWPIGGFVRIKGMLPEDDGSETRIPGGFYSKAPWKRFIVLLAGPAFSVATGILVLIPVLMFDGMPKPSNEPVLGETVPGKPADRAGLKKGDRVLAVNGKPITKFYEMISVVRVSAGQTVDLKVSRGGKVMDVKATPEADPDASPVFDEDMNPSGETKRNQGKLYVGFKSVEKTRLPLAQAASQAVLYPILAVENIASIATRRASFQENVGGPAAIVTQTAGAVALGPVNVVTLAAFLSISVGIFNLLPIFPLDGGQMLLAVAEMFRGGRRLSMRVQNVISSVGLGLMAILIVSVLLSDANRLLHHPTEPKTVPVKK